MHLYAELACKHYVFGHQSLITNFHLTSSTYQHFSDDWFGLISSVQFDWFFFLSDFIIQTYLESFMNI